MLSLCHDKSDGLAFPTSDDSTNLAPSVSKALPSGSKHHPCYPSVKGSFRSQRPKETRTRQRTSSQQLTRFRKESIVIKGVPFGELISSLRKETTDQLMPGTLQSAAGRFAFLASSGKGLRRASWLRELSPHRAPTPLSPCLSHIRAKTLRISDWQAPKNEQVGPFRLRVWVAHFFRQTRSSRKYQPLCSCHLNTCAFFHLTAASSNGGLAPAAGVDDCGALEPERSTELMVVDRKLNVHLCPRLET